MAVMDAAIIEALWRHTSLIKYVKPNNYWVLKNILLQFVIDVKF